MREPAVGCRTVPVHHVGSDLHHIARPQLPCGFAPLLIVPSAGRDKQQLSTAMAVPVIAASGTECHIRHRTVQGFAAHQRRKIGLTDKIGRKFLRQLLALREDLPKGSILFHRVFLCMNCFGRNDHQRKDDCVPIYDSSHHPFVFRFLRQSYDDSAPHDLCGLRIPLPFLPIRPQRYFALRKAMGDLPV